VLVLTYHDRGVSYCKGSVAAEIANPAKRGDSVLEIRENNRRERFWLQEVRRFFIMVYIQLKILAALNTLVQNS
jgi:hypothetical protein